MPLTELAIKALKPQKTIYRKADARPFFLKFIAYACALS